MKVVILTLYFFIALINFANAGEMYNCIDREGNAIFTDIPQDGMKCVSKKRDVDLVKTGLNAKEEQKSSKLTESLIIEQPTDSPSTKTIDHQEQNPVPYHCVKLCIQDHRKTLKACSGDRYEYRNCMTKSHEQVNNCRKKCQDEESSAASNNVERDNIKTHSKNTSSGISTTQLQTVNFELVDKRNPAEREGYPYPNSPLRHHVMHGDRSLNVDRLSILKTKLRERFGSKLKGKIIELTQFYVLEAILGPLITSGRPGDPIPNGPYLPTLVSEITITLDGDYFHGSVHFPMRLGSKATESSLTIATTKAVDDLLKDMERSWNRQ